MLQGIRSSTLTVPSFGHSLSLTGVQKMEGYGDVDPWSWNPQQSTTSLPPYQPVYDTAMYSSTPNTPETPHSAHPRHHPIPSSHPGNNSHTSTPPPARQQPPAKSVKAQPQPAFRPTWFGYLDTTKDAMTIVEAALQGRLSHISRRPNDKERTQMLTSGTVLVYEENASGIRRWTDAVHWSPSRVMNNCLIYRQLVRALRPEEKRAALNPSCGSKRKRKESASSAFPDLKTEEDEYEHSMMENTGDTTPIEAFGKVYANFAQSLTPDQQRRFCGSLIDSYDFKEGGLMKKTISVKYQGTHHHVISYYSLEDVVSGKLKRPFQDPKLADIHPRPELLSGWKVSLDDEENKDAPLFASYSQRLSTSHVQHAPVSAAAHNLGAPNVSQSHAPVHLRVSSEYWHGANVQPYASPQHTSSYGPPHHTASPYAQQSPQEYPAQQTPAQQFSQAPSSHPYTQLSPTQPQYTQRPSEYPGQSAHSQQYLPHSAQATGPTSFPTQSQPAQPYPAATPTQQYPEQHPTSPYQDTQAAPIAQQSQFPLPQSQFEISVPGAHALPMTPVHQAAPGSIQQQDAQRRASAPVAMQTYGQTSAPTHYQPEVQSPEFYISDQKFHPGSYGYQ